MNERLKELRKYLGLTQKSFAQKLGITDSGLSNLENGKRNLTEQMIISICREYNVNRDWLVDGAGDMFADLSGATLEDFIRKYDLTTYDLAFISDYCNLPKEHRAIIMQFFNRYYEV